MRNLSPLQWALIVCAVVTAVLMIMRAASGHAVAGPEAANYRYVQNLTDSGWDVEDEAQMIRVAHAECGIRAEGTTTDADLSEQVQAHYRITADAARTQLAAAEAAYCPDDLGD